MAASVQVLCPNGRRQNVKINPNTKLLQILEEVCQRQGLNTPEDYKLIHCKKDLDLSLSVRFSALPNNCKLELAKSSSARQEKDVIIALQLDGGQRLQGSFAPSTEIWNILLHFEDKNNDYKGVLTRVDRTHSPPLIPVCIYMREEVIGEHAMKATTLRKLGLTSGKVILRLIHRPVDTEMLSNIVDQVEKDKLKQAKLEEIAAKKIEENQMSSSAEPAMSFSAMDTSETNAGNESNMEVIQEAVEDSNTEHESAMVLSADPPHQTRNSAVEELRSLNLPGVEIFTPDDFHDLTPEEQRIARRLAQRFTAQFNPNPSISNNTNSSTRQRNQPSFVDFRFPDETRGQDLTANTESQNSNSRLSEPCNRDALVYSTEEKLPGSQNEEVLNDDFFEVTTEDVKKMYKDLQNTVQKMEESPLMTASLRHAMSESAFDSYEKIIIRIQFPERLTLQALFRPREKVSALYDFVRGFLADKNQKFYLYTSPPKTVLSDKNKSLASNRLAPAALVYFGSEIQKDHYIQESSRLNLSSRIKAEAAVDDVLGSGSGKPSSTQMTTGNSLSKPGPSGVSRPVSSNSTRSIPADCNQQTLPSGAQVPKWLKLSKK